MTARFRATFLGLLAAPVLLAACDAGGFTYPCEGRDCEAPPSQPRLPSGPYAGGAGGTSPGTTPTPGSNGSVATLTGELKSIVDLTNAERVKAGRRPLIPNTLLMQAASLTNRELISSGIWAHLMPGTQYPSPVDRVDATGYRWQMMGENLGKGMNMTAAAMVAAWVASPGHYANMIDPGFTEIGVAIDVAPDGTVFMTQEFGQP